MTHLFINNQNKVFDLFFIKKNISPKFVKKLFLQMLLKNPSGIYFIWYRKWLILFKKIMKNKKNIFFFF